MPVFREDLVSGDRWPVRPGSLLHGAHAPAGSGHSVACAILTLQGLFALLAIQGGRKATARGQSVWASEGWVPGLSPAGPGRLLGGGDIRAEWSWLGGRGKASEWQEYLGQRCSGASHASACLCQVTWAWHAVSALGGC